MADSNKPAVSFDDIIQEGRRKKAAENLAQRLLGKGRRSSAPPNSPKLGGSLASRVGVQKPRNSSLPRSNTPRGPRNVAPLSRARDEPLSRPASTRPSLPPKSATVANGNTNGLSIRGAASAPPVIVAQNFAPGTTAADIESVMQRVGGEITSCRLVASNPTVIAEMSFVDPAGADAVIEQYNGKKADGRTLYVYRREDGGARRTTAPPTPAPLHTPALAPDEGDTMMVDEAAEAREANNRMREERRGRDDRESRDVFPSGPRGYRDDYRDPGPRRSEGSYTDGRYGFGGGGGYAPRGNGGRYGGYERNYGGGRSWRP